MNYLKTILVVLTISILMGYVPPSHSQQEIPKPTKAKLVSHLEKTDTGIILKIGVLFQIDPGWHIYWKYPGESGLPTKIKLEVPESYSAGKVNWPIPSTYKNPDGGVDYGYANSVLLWSDIEIPEAQDHNELPEFSVQVSWLSCKEICIPGKASFSAQLDLSKLEKSDSQNIFANWQSSLPISNLDKKNSHRIKVDVVQVDKQRVEVDLGISLDPKYDKVEFYPSPGDFLKVVNLINKESQSTNNTEVSFDVVSKNGKDFSNNTIPGLIVYSDEDGKRRAFEINISLNNS